MRSLKIEVFSKTGCRCAYCGTYSNLSIGYFLPKWIKTVSSDIRNQIPECTTCRTKHGVNLLELRLLSYLPNEYKNEIMSFYSDNRGFIRKYVLSFGQYRTEGLLDLERSLVILKSYDLYIKDNEVIK